MAEHYSRPAPVLSLWRAPVLVRPPAHSYTHACARTHAHAHDTSFLLCSHALSTPPLASPSPHCSMLSLFCFLPCWLAAPARPVACAACLLLPVCFACACSVAAGWRRRHRGCGAPLPGGSVDALLVAAVSVGAGVVGWLPWPVGQPVVGESPQLWVAVAWALLCALCVTRTRHQRSVCRLAVGGAQWRAPLVALARVTTALPLAHCLRPAVSSWRLMRTRVGRLSSGVCLCGGRLPVSSRTGARAMCALQPFGAATGSPALALCPSLRHGWPGAASRLCSAGMVGCLLRGCGLASVAGCCLRCVPVVAGRLRWGGCGRAGRVAVGRWLLPWLSSLLSFPLAGLVAPALHPMLPPPPLPYAGERSSYCSAPRSLSPPLMLAPPLPSFPTCLSPPILSPLLLAPLRPCPR